MGGGLEVGMKELEIGMKEMEVGMKELKVGMKMEIGMKEMEAGMEMEMGMKEMELGMKEMEVGKGGDGSLNGRANIGNRVWQGGKMMERKTLTKP